MMGFIASAKSGWYSGKGFKASRKGNYEKALHYYEIALKNSENRDNPVVYDSIAIAHYNQKNYVEAISNAEKNLEQYESYQGEDQRIFKRIKKLKELIQILKKEK